MPVNWLKLMAFAFGAAVAALTGTFAAALNGSVFPQNFEFPLLITIYTMVILGGAGSQAGVVLGAVLVSVLLEAAPRSRRRARALLRRDRPLGLVGDRSARRSSSPSSSSAPSSSGSWRDSWRARSTTRGPRSPAEESGRLADWASDWVIVPEQLAGWVAPVTYVSLVALALVLTLVQGWARIALLVPTLYLAAFVWENVMLPQPESAAVHRPRRDPRRADDRAAAGPARREARGDRLAAASRSSSCAASRWRSAA